MTTDKQLLTARLLRSSSVTVSVDPRRIGVTVPLMYRDSYQLDLRVGGMATVSKTGITGTCTVAKYGESIAVTIPWHAAFAIVGDGDPTSGKVWTADFPPELKRKFQKLNDRGLAKCGPEKRQRAVSTKVAKVIDLGAYRARKALVP